MHLNQVAQIVHGLMTVSTSEDDDARVSFVFKQNRNYKSDAWDPPKWLSILVKQQQIVCLEVHYTSHRFLWQKSLQA
jgi:hypothetical protein